MLWLSQCCGALCVCVWQTTQKSRWNKGNERKGRNLENEIDAEMKLLQEWCQDKREWAIGKEGGRGEYVRQKEKGGKGEAVVKRTKGRVVAAGYFTRFSMIGVVLHLVGWEWI